MLAKPIPCYGSAVSEAKSEKCKLNQKKNALNYLVHGYTEDKCSIYHQNIILDTYEETKSTELAQPFLGKVIL